MSVKYSRMEAFEGFKTNRQLMIGWIDHILYKTEGIDEYLNSNMGIQIDMKELNLMPEAELAETYYMVAEIRDMLSPE